MILNNTKLTTFQYSLTNLQYLYIINNSLMTSFTNSSLPNLHEFVVVNTPLVFQNNTFGQLNKVNFTHVPLNGQLPPLDNNVKELILDSNNITQLNISAFPNIIRLYTVGNNITQLQLTNLPTLTNVAVISPGLQNLTILNTSTSNLTLMSQKATYIRI